MAEDNSKDLENKRLEVEKLRLEVEMQKLELEKSRISTGDTQIPKLPNQKTVFESWNMLGVVFGIISISTLFFPWVEGVASGSVSLFGYNSSSSFSSGSISGISTSEGQLCMLLTLIGIYLNFKGNRIAGIIGIICSIFIFVFASRMLDLRSSVMSSGMTGSFEMKILDPLMYSFLSYIIFSIFSIWNFAKTEKEKAIGILISIATSIIILWLQYIEGNNLFILIVAIPSYFIYKKYSFTVTKTFIPLIFAISTFDFLFQSISRAIFSPYWQEWYGIFDVNSIFMGLLVALFIIVFVIELINKLVDQELGKTKFGLFFPKKAYLILSLVFIGFNLYYFAIELPNQRISTKEEELSNLDSIKEAEIQMQKAMEAASQLPIEAEETTARDREEAIAMDGYDDEQYYSQMKKKRFQGIKKFCDELGNWYYIVNIKGDNVQIDTFAGENNTTIDDKLNPTKTEHASIDDANQIWIEKNGVPEKLYDYIDGKWLQLNNEGNWDSYEECNTNSKVSE